MSAINEGFVGDDELGDVRGKSPPLARRDSGLLATIDYSKARKRPIIGAALAATMGAYILGCFIGWGSPCQPQLQQQAGSFVSVTDPDSIWFIDLSDSEMSWVSSLVNLGAMIGALMGGMLMDRLGRKLVLVSMSVPAALGWLLIVAAVDPSMLYIGRFLGGFSGGVCSVAAPTYVGEIAIPSVRGVLGFFFQLMVVTGILITSLFGLGLDWRWISAISAIDPLVFLVAMIFVPETPYYLIKKGRIGEAEDSLKWLRGPEYDIEPEMAQTEARVRIELAQSSRFSDLFKPWAFKPMLVAMGLMMFQQFSGINAALFNAVFIFNAAGSTLDPLLSAVLLNVDQVVVTLVSSQLVERFGRRTLFLMSTAIMSIAMFALGAFFYIQEHYDEETVASLGWLPLTSLIVFIAAFGLGAGPMPWLMFGEILPAKVRGPGGSAAAFSNWFLAFIITLTFVDIQEAMTPAGAFWMFGCFCILAVLFSIFLLPETKGKTPEQIQSYFGIRSANTTEGSLQQSSDRA